MKNLKVRLQKGEILFIGDKYELYEILIKHRQDEKTK